MDVLVVTVVHDPQDARIRHRQIAALLRRGHRVTFAAPFSAYDRSDSAGVATVDLPRARGRRRLRAVVAARRLLREEAARYDVVLLHDPELLLAAGRRVREVTRVVWDVHEDTAAALTLKPWLPVVLRRPVAAAIRLAEEWAERHVALLLAEEGYRSRFRQQHPVVPNSVLVPADEPPPPGQDRVVYLGRLTRARGALELLEVGRRLRGRITVELIGNADGDVAQAVQAAHREGAVNWTGFLPNDQALARLPGALAGLSLLHDQPNYQHSRPTKLMEYMAHGVPVVTTPNKASNDLVARHRCGVVVPFAGVEEVVEAVEHLRRDRTRRRSLGAAGRRAAVEQLSWWRDADAFIDSLAGRAEPRLARSP